MTAKCVSLHKEHEESQKTLSDYRSAFEEYKRRAAENEDRTRDLENRRVETAKQIQVFISQDNLARTRIDELEKERGDMIQQHRVATNITVDRMNSAEQKVEELKKIIGTFEHWEVASTCLTPSPEQSPEAVKRPKSDTKQHPVRPSKHRKCKDATKMWEEDTIVVRN